MQNKPRHPKKTARPVGGSRPFLKRNRWSETKIPSPLDTPLMGTPSLDSLQITPEKNIYFLKRAFWHPPNGHPPNGRVGFSFF